MPEAHQPVPSRLVPNPHAMAPELGTPTEPRSVTVDGQAVWVMSRHEDVRTCLAHPDLTRPATYARSQGWPTPFAKLFDDTLFSTDPPEHTRLRRLLQRAFTTRRVQALRPRIQDITDSLLDRIAPRGHADLVTDLALPLPAQVISELLGVPPADRDRFSAWADTMLWSDTGPDATRTAHQAGEEFWAYIQRLTDAKVINARYAKTDVRIADVDIRRATRSCLDAANRDPAQFEQAGELDLTRQPNPHVQFGHGWGHCIGASLARLEGQIAIGALVSRFPDLSLDREPAELLPRPDAALRSLNELPVRFTPRPEVVDD